MRNQYKQQNLNMKKNPEYVGARHVTGCNDYYGEKVTAYFYVGDKIVEGESFGKTEETAYIDDMGSDWQKGHMLAKSLGGDNELHNLLPMKEDVNNSIFKKVENFVQTLFDNLNDIQTLCDVGNLHIKYTVERLTRPIKNVKGHKFPGAFMYSIDVLQENGQTVNSVKLFEALIALQIIPDVKFKDTLSVD